MVDVSNKSLGEDLILFILFIFSLTNVCTGMYVILVALVYLSGNIIMYIQTVHAHTYK